MLTKLIGEGRRPLTPFYAGGRPSCSLRAKLVRASARGRGVYAIAREVVAEIEREWTARLGAGNMRRLRGLLQELNDGLGEERPPH